MRNNDQIEIAQAIIENLQDYIVLAKAQQKVKNDLRINDLECGLNEISKIVKEMVENI